MMKLLLFLALFLSACTQDNSIQLECNGIYFFRSKINGAYTKSRPNMVEDINLIFDIQKNTLNEIGYHKFSDIPCKEFTSSIIRCKKSNADNSTNTLIKFDRLSGEVVATKTENSSTLNYIYEESFEGKCKKITRKF